MFPNFKNLGLAMILTSVLASNSECQYENLVVLKYFPECQENSETLEKTVWKQVIPLHDIIKKRIIQNSKQQRDRLDF